jgi:hypothetical protein
MVPKATYEAMTCTGHSLHGRKSTNKREGKQNRKVMRLSKQFLKSVIIFLKASRIFVFAFFSLTRQQKYINRACTETTEKFFFAFPENFIS